MFVAKQYFLRASSKTNFGSLFCSWFGTEYTCSSSAVNPGFGYFDDSVKTCHLAELGISTVEAVSFGNHGEIHSLCVLCSLTSSLLGHYRDFKFLPSDFKFWDFPPTFFSALALEEDCFSAPRKDPMCLWEISLRFSFSIVQGLLPYTRWWLYASRLSGEVLFHLSCFVLGLQCAAALCLRMWVSFSSSALLQVFEALGEELKDRVGEWIQTYLVNGACLDFKLPR